MNTFPSVISLTNHVDHPSLAQTNCVALFSAGPCGLPISSSSILCPEELHLFFVSSSFFFRFYCYCSHVLEAKPMRRLFLGVCRTKIAEIQPLICRFTSNGDIWWVILRSVFHALHLNLYLFHSHHMPSDHVTALQCLEVSLCTLCISLQPVLLL